MTVSPRLIAELSEGAGACHADNGRCGRFKERHYRLKATVLMFPSCEAGDALIDMAMRTANGRSTAAEALGHREFVMTKLYRSA